MQTLEGWRSRTRRPDEFAHADVAFSLGRVALTSERASSGSSKLRLTGVGQLKNDGGAFVIERVSAMLLGQDGSLVRTQRYHDDDSPLVIGNHTSWTHEVYDAELAAAHSVRYVIETRVQTICTLMTCELGTVDVVAESATWPIVSRHVVPNDLVMIDVALSTKRGKRMDISVMAESSVVHRDHSVATEFYFLNRDGIAVASGATRLSLVNGFAHDRTGAGFDRTTASAISSLLVRGRIEVSLLSELDPIELPESCRIAR